MQIIRFYYGVVWEGQNIDIVIMQKIKIPSCPGAEEHLQIELAAQSNYGEFKKLPMQYFSIQVSSWINLFMCVWKLKEPTWRLPTSNDDWIHALNVSLPSGRKLLKTQNLSTVEREKQEFIVKHWLEPWRRRDYWRSNSKTVMAILIMRTAITVLNESTGKCFACVSLFKPCSTL